MSMSTINNICIPLLFCGLIYSQEFTREINTIEFSSDGIPYSNAFSGGANNLEPQFVDIDGDDDYDLFYLCSDGSYEWMENVGSASDPVFELRMDKIPGLDFKDWFYFVDIDGDNDFDLFTGGESNLIKFLKNKGSVTSPSFEIEVDTLKDIQGNIVFSESVSNSVFVDVDADNDHDFITGNQAGTLNFYENIGTPRDFIFDTVKPQWQGIVIIGGGIEAKHGASALEFGDLDNDNDPDLLWGDFFSRSLYYLENRGTPQIPNIGLIHNVFPFNGDSLTTRGFNMPRLVDLDGDLDMDLTVSVLYDPTVPQSLIFFENRGDAFVSDFRKTTDDYLNLLDVGTKSIPSFADMDNDGDLDLFAGSEKNPFGTLYYFKNTGDRNSPQFSLVDTNYFGIEGELSISPATGDIDGDGDIDLLIGTFLGKIGFYRNIGSSSVPNFVPAGNLTDDTGTEIKVSNFIRPILFDADLDHDLDLVLGAFNGRIILYRNIGTPTNFIFQLDEGYFSGIDVGDQSYPFLADPDNDSDFDLFAGNREGNIYFYRNDGNINNPLFALVTENYIPDNLGSETVPYFIDIDGDTDDDLLIGNVKGGFYFYRNLTVTSLESNSSDPNPSTFDIMAYPNPFNSRLNIFVNVNQKGFYALEIFNILGKKIETLFYGELNSGEHDFSWDSDENFSSGIYFIRAGSGSINQSIKVLLIK